jgi:Type IV secretion system pilin
VSRFNGRLRDMISQNKMQKIKKFLINNSAFVIVFMLLIMPSLSFAYTLGDPLVPPCTNCGWNDLLLLVNNVITFILEYMVIPIAAIMFVYAGFELVTSGGSTEKRGIAKKVFTNTVIGLILAVAATLIVKMILSISGYTGPSLLF